MLKKLEPLLKTASLSFILTQVSDGVIRVVLQPKPLTNIGVDGGKGVDEARRALTTGLAIEGTADELDEKLGDVIASFVAERL